MAIEIIFSDQKIGLKNRRSHIQDQDTIYPKKKNYGAGDGDVNTTVVSNLQLDEL